MLQDAEIDGEEQADDWAIRSELWLNDGAKAGPKRRKRERTSAPLVLCGHGVSLRVEQGALVIRDGFTHYPQEQAVHRFFRGGLDVPPRIAVLDGSGTLSFDVLSWLSEQGVTLLRIKWTGEFAVAGAGSGYAADAAKVAWQSDTRSSLERRLAFSTDLIGRKLEASIATLELHFDPSGERDTAITKARAGVDRLRGHSLKELKDVYGIEADCAGAYFNVWRSLAISWVATSRKQIPADWHSFSSRNSLLSGIKPKNRRASHPVNALLNYAYTVRQSKLQIEAISEGYDPTIGIMHNAHQGSSAYILDLIEPDRPVVDAVVLAFIKSRSFSASDFVIKADGVCRLSPQLARAIASAVIN